MTAMVSDWTDGREFPTKTHDDPEANQPLGGTTGKEFSPLIEAEKFNEMMEIIGPRGRDDFLDCLVKDLSDVARSLDHAIECHDAVEAKRKTHILIGLAGTVGAARLHDMALTLHRNLAQDVGSGLTSRGVQTLAELDRLIRFVTGAAEPRRLA